MSGWAPGDLGFTPAPGETLAQLRKRVLDTIEVQAERTVTVRNVARWAIEACPAAVRAVTIRDMMGYNAEGLGIVEVDLHWSWWRRPWRNRSDYRGMVAGHVHFALVDRLPVHLELRVS